MARNSFYVNTETLYDELNALSDDELAKRLEANHDFLFDGMSEDVIQDCAQIEHMKIEARQIQRVGERIQQERAAARVALDQGGPRHEPGL